MLFVHPDCLDAARAARFSGPPPRLVVFGTAYEALLSAADPAPYVPVAGEWDVFSIPFTSGTTGKPRGCCCRTARALLFHAMAVEYGCFGPEDSFLAIAPFAHGAGLAFALAPIFFGGTTELVAEFDAADVVARLAEGGFTGVFMVPTHLHQIFALNTALLAADRDVALKSLISNAAALPQRMKSRIIAQRGEGLLHETYGSTVIGIACHIRPVDQLRKQGSVGLAFPDCWVRLPDEAGREVAPHEVGELYTNSPFICNGYWQDGRAAALPLRDGWFSAGDLATRDEEGYIHIVDRKGDMVVSGGINIYPRQIEEVLYRHADVVEVAVVGVPDETWGERLRAHVVLRARTTADGAALETLCRGELSGYKVPREFVFTEALPKNASGKILKRELRAAVLTPDETGRYRTVRTAEPDPPAEAKPLSARAIYPKHFPWFNYSHYSFSLAVATGDNVYVSGHTASEFDPESKRMVIRGDLAAQTRTAYAKIGAILEGAGKTHGDIVRMVEYVRTDAIERYEQAAGVRTEVFGAHRPAVNTVPVKALLRPDAEIELEATVGPVGEGTRFSTGLPGARESAGVVYLPTVQATDAAGNIIGPGDIVAQTEVIFEKASRMLSALGLGFRNVVKTLDYLTPEGLAEYRYTGAVRKAHLGPVYPASAGILMPRLLHRDALIQYDFIASRDAPIAVNPGWDRYAKLTYSPGVKAGKLLFLSGQAALDPASERMLFDDNVVAQAEYTYVNILRVVEAAGGRAEHLAKTIEYVTPSALPRYREVAAVRAKLLREPYPSSTGIICDSLLRPEMMIEVDPHAVLW